jgi:hypothetical protein
MRDRVQMLDTFRLELMPTKKSGADKDDGSRQRQWERWGVPLARPTSA